MWSIFIVRRSRAPSSTASTLFGTADGQIHSDRLRTDLIALTVLFFRVFIIVTKKRWETHPFSSHFLMTLDDCKTQQLLNRIKAIPSNKWCTDIYCIFSNSNDMSNAHTQSSEQRCPLHVNHRCQECRLVPVAVWQPQVVCWPRKKLKKNNLCWLQSLLWVQF